MKSITFSQKFSVIDAPSILGLKQSGVQDLPRALKSAGIIDKLNADYSGLVNPPSFNPERDKTTLLLNPYSIKEYSIALSDEVIRCINNNYFPVVLGGDCSILIGCLLALRRLGSYGLFFIDGHADFYQPEAEPEGEVASMELALVTGRGPDILSNINGLKPYVRDNDVAVFGYRDIEEQKRHQSQDIRETDINSFELKLIRELGIEQAGELALTKLKESNPDGLWIHLDADVLDSEIMPAVDYLQPDGLKWEELTTLLKIIMRSGLGVGITITILNPHPDPDGSIAAKFTKSIIAGLT